MSKVIHPTREEIIERFNKEVNEVLLNPSEEILAAVRLEVIAKWKKKGLRVDNLPFSEAELLYKKYKINP